LILSYKAFAVILLYGLLAWRVAHPAMRGAVASTSSPTVAVTAGAPT
jgi:hypothetical protein